MPRYFRLLLLFFAFGFLGDESIQAQPAKVLNRPFGAGNAFTRQTDDGQHTTNISSGLHLVESATANITKTKALEPNSLPFIDILARPMRVYCKDNECTSAGEISRNIGKAITRMFQTSLPGVLNERIATNVKAMEYAARRGSTAPTRSDPSISPTSGPIEKVLKESVDTKVIVGDDRTSSSENSERVLIWNDLELVNPPDSRRKANMMARLEARNSFTCRVSGGLLPYCHDQIITNDFVEKYDDGGEVVGGFGVRLSGVAASCSIQGGCRLNFEIDPAIFDGVYWSERLRSEFVLYRNDSKRQPYINRLDLHFNATEVANERFGWKSQNVELTFAAIVLPNKLDLKTTIKSSLPFLFVEPNLGPEVDVLDLWGKNWLDWRVGQNCQNAAFCLGVFDFKKKLCIVPLALTLEPIGSWNKD